MIYLYLYITQNIRDYFRYRASLEMQDITRETFYTENAA